MCYNYTVIKLLKGDRATHSTSVLLVPAPTTEEPYTAVDTVTNLKHMTNQFDPDLGSYLCDMLLSCW